MCLLQQPAYTDCVPGEQFVINQLILGILNKRFIRIIVRVYRIKKKKPTRKSPTPSCGGKLSVYAYSDFGPRESVVRYNRTRIEPSRQVLWDRNDRSHYILLRYVGVPIPKPSYERFSFRARHARVWAGVCASCRVCSPSPIDTTGRGSR